MPNLTVRNISKDVYAVLRQDARRNRRSINAEVLAALSDKAEMGRRRKRAAKAMRELDRLREEIYRQYPNAPESVELIREARDSR